MRLAFWLGVILSVLLVEAAYRGYLYSTYVLGAAFYVTTISPPQEYYYIGTPHNVHGPYEPGKMAIDRYDAGGEKFQSLTIGINNLGWVSRFDYQVDKKDSEYRVAIIGDSMTASINNELPWPDFLREYLNQDAKLVDYLDGKSFTVLNISSPGSTMAGMADKLLDTAMRFDPDLVIVNFPAGAVIRANETLIAAEDRDFSLGPPEPLPAPPPDLVIDGVEIRLFGCDSPMSLSNPACRVVPAWYLPPGVNFGKEQLNEVKTELAWRIISSRVLFSIRPNFLFELFGDPVIPRGSEELAPLSIRSPEAEAVDALSTIVSIQPNTVVTHNPVYWTITGAKTQDVETLRKVTELAASRGIGIVDVTEFMPITRGDEELRSWFNLPFDGHFSDHGAMIYARAMEEVIREHIMGSAAITPDVRQCLDAYEVFKAGQALLDSDQPAALAKLDEVTRLLPPDAGDLAKTGSYRTCGYLPDLDFARAEALLAAGDPKGEAMAALDRVLAVQPEHLDALIARGDLRSRAGDTAGAAADYGTAVRTEPKNNIGLIAKYANALLASGDAPGAAVVWTKAIEIAPDSVALLLQRGASYMAAGQFDRATSDYEEVLDRSPSNMGALKGLAEANEAQGNYDGAIRYYSDMIAADPELVWVYLRRAKIYERLGRAEALDDYAAATRIDPENIAIWTKHGLILRDAGELERAIAIWTNGLEVEPASVALLLLRAAAYVNTEKPDEAEADYRAVLDVAPENVGALKGLAEIDIAQGDFEDAVRHYDTVLAAEPTTIWALAGRAKAYDGLGRAEDAAADREKVKAIRAAA